MTIRTDRRLIIIYIILSITLMAVFTPIFFNLKGRIDVRLDRIESEFFRTAEEMLGYKISYSSVSPSLLGHLEVRALTIYLEETGENLLFIDRLNIFYSFFNFFNEDPLKAIEKISIENTHINYDPDRNLDLDFIKQFSGDGTGTLSLPRVEITGRNISLSMQLGENSVNLEKIFLKMDPVEDGWGISMKGAGFYENREAIGAITTDFSLNGFIDNDFDRAEALLNLKDLDSDYLSMRKINFLLNWRDKSISVRKIQDRVPYDLMVLADLETKSVEVEFKAENFIPSNHFTFNTGFDFIEPILYTGISGKLDGQYYFETRELDYNSELNLKIPINQWIPIPIDADVVASGDLNRIKFDKLDVDSRNGSIFFIGDIDLTEDLPLPNGHLKVNNLNGRGHNFSGMLILDNQSRYYSIQAPWLILDELNLRDTDVRLMGDLDNVDIFVETSSADVDWDNYLFAEGNFIMGEEPFFQILLECFDFPVGKSGLTFLPDINDELKDQISPLSLNAQGSLSTDLEKFSFNASRFELKNREDPSQYLTLTGSGNNSGMSFRNLYFLYGDLELSGNGSANWESQNSLSFSSNLDFQDTPYSINGVFEPEISLYLSGDYGLEGTAYFQADTTFFNLKAEDFPIPYKGKEYRIDLDGRGDFTSLENWHLLLNSGALQDIPLDTEGARVADVNLSGRFAPREGRLYNIVYEDDYAPLEGNAEFTYALNGDDAGINGWLQMFNKNGSEEYSADFHYHKEALTGDLTIIDLPVLRFGDTPLSGYITSNASIAGRLSSPDIQLDINLDEGEFNGIPLELGTRLSLTEDILTIDEMELKYLNNGLNIDSGSYDLLGGIAGLEGTYKGTLQENPVSADFAINVGLTPVDIKFDILKALEEDGFQSVLSVDNIYIFETPHDPWDISSTFHHGKLEFYGGPQNTISGYYDFEEGFDVAVVQPMPMNFRARGRLEGGNIDAELSDIFMNFQTIEQYFSIPGFTLMSGEAVGSLKVTGALADPDLFGSLDVSNLIAMLSIMKKPLTLNKTTIKANQKTLNIDNIIVEAEKGGVIMNCEFILDHLIPYSYSIYIETIHNRDPYLEFTFPRVMLEGFGQGIIYLDGDLNELNVSGNLKVHSGHVTVDPEMPERVISRIDKNINLGVDLGNNNTFYWPSQKFPILKAYAESGDHLDFHFNSGKNAFGFKGQVNVKGGEIFYFRRNFYLQDGIMIFNENQDRFNPILDARAVIREVDKNGELIKIFLIADSMPLLDFEPRFESNPYLTNQEIVTLLGANLFNSQENEVALNDAILLTSDVVSQFGFFQSIEDSVKDNLGLDVFSLRSQIVPNLIMERFLPGEELAKDASFARYLDNTTLFIGKYLGNDLFLQGVIQMDYYDANVVDDLYFNPKFNIDTEVTLEWKSPVALIELSLYPDFFDQSDSLLTSSLSLSWSFSF
ncbi:MAG: translocation/assembly module TamB domain-containing protein [Spirochaetales bacterium]|nr:translocation/assembly module TamB domain-containing protein [Spirochaetales bacterium]